MNESMNEIKQHLISVREAAECAGYQTQTIRNWLTCGRLSKYKRGNRTFVDRREVENLSKVIPA
jgi:hypothetical protein